MCPQNYFYIKKVQKKQNKKTFKRLQSLADSGDKISTSGRFLRPHFP